MPFIVPNSHIQYATYAKGKWTKHLVSFPQSQQSGIIDLYNSYYKNLQTQK